MATSRTMRQLARIRLDERLQPLRQLLPQTKAAPHGGWIRAIREALGMPRRELGRRMRVGFKRVQQMELNEVRGKLTIESLARAADALDCELLVALVPREPLQERVQNRRQELAQKWIRRRTMHTMSLEDQAIRFEDLPASTIHEIESNFPDERLWEEP